MEVCPPQTQDELAGFNPHPVAYTCKKSRFANTGCSVRAAMSEFSPLCIILLHICYRHHTLAMVCVLCQGSKAAIRVNIDLSWAGEAQWFNVCVSVRERERVSWHLGLFYSAVIFQNNFYECACLSKVILCLKSMSSPVSIFISHCLLLLWHLTFIHSFNIFPILQTHTRVRCSSM